MTTDMLSRRHVILSGCSGGGKSTLLAELARRGFQTVEEPGRRIVAEELAGDGRALPWNNLEAFARRALDLALKDRDAVQDSSDRVFFDRGLIDAAAALEHAARIPVEQTLSGQPGFHPQVFLTPPWPEIYSTDSERKTSLDEGVSEYERLLGIYDRLGYQTVILPKVSVEDRADFVLDRLS